MTQTLVEGREITRSFKVGTSVTEALKPASFSICTGDRMGIVGASGSGKSTLLNIIAGLDRPTSGTIAWPALGSAEDLRPLNVSMVHQYSALLPSLSVLENIVLPLKLGGKDIEEGTLRGILMALDLEELSNRMPTELSGGQAQRVNIARALLHSPKLIVADEPTGLLDRELGAKALSALLAATERSGSALIVATHDWNVASRLRTIWTMAHGILKQDPDDQC